FDHSHLSVSPVSFRSRMVPSARAGREGNGSRGRVRQFSGYAVQPAVQSVPPGWNAPMYGAFTNELSIVVQSARVAVAASVPPAGTRPVGGNTLPPMLSIDESVVV